MMFSTLMRAVGVTFLFLFVFLLVRASFGALNDSCGEKECIPTNDTFNGPLEPLLDTVGSSFVLIGVIVVVFAVSTGRYLALKFLRNAGIRKIANGDLVWDSEIKAPDYTQENMRKVVGWRNASSEDLRALPPVELQPKLDRDNMFSLEIFGLLDLIPQFEGSTTRRDQRRVQQMHAHLRLLREQPEVVARKALAPKVDALIARAEESVQSVQELPEG